MRLEAVVGTLGWAVALAWFCLAVGRRFAPAWLLVVGGAASALVASPILRGAFSDLSMTSAVLCGAVIASALGRTEWLTPRDLRATLRFALGGGLFLYPLALGVGPFDPYDLGYRSPGLVLFFGFLAGITWWLGLRLPVVCLSAGAGAFAGGMLPTDNLWDYVLDPFVVTAAIVDLTWRPQRSRPEEKSLK